MGIKLKSLDRPRTTLDAESTPKSNNLPKELSQLALRSQEITADIRSQLQPEVINETVDYKRLARSAANLTETVKKIHDQNPVAVDYSSWMLLPQLAHTLKNHPDSKTKILRRKRTDWESVWETARQTATGKEFIEEDVELQKILEEPEPPSYQDVMLRNFYSDQRYRDVNLDDYYGTSDESDVTARAETTPHPSPELSIAKVAIRSSSPARQSVAA